MLVLLPPSEGKTPAPSGHPALDLTSLSAPQLTARRREVLDSLIKVSSRPDAFDVLGVSAGLGDDVARNVTLDTAPATQARHVYTGVLFAAAGLAKLDGLALDRAARHVRVVSALWGLVSPVDVIPAYRLAMDRSLPAVGPLAKAWRAPLARVLDPIASQQMIVDCRSTTYQAAWRPGAGASAWVTVRVVRDGRVVSHAAKHTRGVLTGHLLTRETAPPHTPEELLEAARELVSTAPKTALADSARSATRPAAPPPRVIGATLRDGPARSQVLELDVA